MLACEQLSTSTGWIWHAVCYADEPALGTEPDAAPEVGNASAPRAGGLKLIFPASRHIGLAPSSGAKAAPAPAPKPGSESMPLDWENVLAHAVNQLLGRAVLLSRNRYLGIGPSVTRPGDCLFVLFGLREAVVLRPRE